MLIWPMPFGAFQPPEPAVAYGCRRLLYFEGYERHWQSHRSGKTTQRLAAKKKLNLIRTINPSSKTLHRPGDGR